MMQPGRANIDEGPMHLLVAVLFLGFVASCAFIIMTLLRFRRPSVDIAVIIFLPFFAVVAVCSAVTAMLVVANLAASIPAGGESLCVHFQSVFQTAKGENSIMLLFYIAFLRYRVAVRSQLPSTTQLVGVSLAGLVASFLIPILLSASGSTGPLDRAGLWCGLTGTAGYIFTACQILLGWTAVALTYACTKPKPEWEMDCVLPPAMQLRASRLTRCLLVTLLINTLSFISRAVLENVAYSDSPTRLYFITACEVLYAVYGIVATAFFFPACYCEDGPSSDDGLPSIAFADGDGSAESTQASKRDPSRKNTLMATPRDGMSVCRALDILKVKGKCLSPSSSPHQSSSTSQRGSASSRGSSHAGSVRLTPRSHGSRSQSPGVLPISGAFFIPSINVGLANTASACSSPSASPLASPKLDLRNISRLPSSHATATPDQERSRAISACHTPLTDSVSVKTPRVV